MNTFANNAYLYVPTVNALKYMNKSEALKIFLRQSAITVTDMGVWYLCANSWLHSVGTIAWSEVNSTPGWAVATTSLVCFLLATLAYPTLLFDRTSTPEQMAAQTLRRHGLHFLLMGAGFGLAAWGVPAVNLYCDAASYFFLITLVWHVGLYALLRYIRAQSSQRREIVLVGRPQEWLPLLSELQRPAHGWRIRGYFADNEEEQTGGIPCLGSQHSICELLPETAPFANIFCTPESIPSETLSALRTYCDKHEVALHFLLPHLNFLQRPVLSGTLGKHFLLSHSRSSLLSPSTQVLKWLFDRLVAVVALLTVFPLIYLIVAIITKRKCPGPILEKSRAFAPDGRAFTALRFRTEPLLVEVVDANKYSEEELPEYDTPTFTFGIWMRRTGFRNWPLLLNLLRGDLSLVGPRIRTEEECETYIHRLTLHPAHHRTRPGLTGLAQITLSHPEIPTPEHTEAEARADIHYMEYATCWLDLHILLRAVFGHRPDAEKNNPN